MNIEKLYAMYGNLAVASENCSDLDEEFALAIGWRRDGSGANYLWWNPAVVAAARKIKQSPWRINSLPMTTAPMYTSDASVALTLLKDEPSFSIHKSAMNFTVQIRYRFGYVMASHKSLAKAICMAFLMFQVNKNNKK